MFRYFSYFILILLFTAGCSYTKVSYRKLDTLTVCDKTGAGTEIDIRNFICPEETLIVLKQLQIENTGNKEVDKIFYYVCSLKNRREKKDYWQKPEETVEQGGGDCEDKALLLASLLIAAGRNDIYAVKGRYLGGGHFWVEDGEYLLDPFHNKKSQRDKTIGYTPFFKFNDQIIYVNEQLTIEDN